MFVPRSFLNKKKTEAPITSRLLYELEKKASEEDEMLK
jgi:hypothetical protein